LQNSNIYGVQGFKYICSSTIAIFHKTLKVVILVFLIKNIISFNINAYLNIYTSSIYIAFDVLIRNYFIFITDDLLHNNNISVKNLAFKAFKKTWPAFLLMLLIYAMIIAGLVLLIIPGIYLFFKFLLAHPALLLQNKSVTSSITYAYDASKNSWWFLSNVSIILQISMAMLPILGYVSEFIAGYTSAKFWVLSVAAVAYTPLDILAMCNIMAIYYVMLERNKVK
jgi:hypothetical protein